MNTSSAAPFDQASGLRELFASLGADGASAVANAPASAAQVPQVHAFICPSRPALALPWLQVCSRQLRQLGMRHVAVDELDFDVREAWPLPGPVRFDLSQSLDHHVPLASAVRPTEDPMSWYAMARRLPALRSDSPALAQRLSDSGLDFDAVLVCAHPAQTRPWRVYGQRVQPVVLCETDPDALSITLTWLQQHAANSPGLDMSYAAWVLLGEEERHAQARTAIDQACQTLFNRSPAWFGGAVLPRGEGLLSLATRWSDLANRWAAGFSVR